MIVIDASPAVHRKAGLGRYTEELITALTAVPAHRAEYALFYHDAAAAKPSAAVRALPCITTAQTSYPWRLRALLAQLLNVSQDSLLRTLPAVGVEDNSGFDKLSHRSQSPISNPQSLVFHATEHLLPRFKQTRTVFTLHDLIFRYFPQHHLPRNRIYLNLAMPLFLRRADAIICVSEHTRRDAMKLYRIPEQKLRVIYEGVDPRFRRVSEPAQLAVVRERYHLPERFILYVGTIEPRKNLPTLFAAFAALIADSQSRDSNLQSLISNLKIVVAGKHGWLVESTLRAEHERGLGGRVHFTGYVADEDLPALLSLAEVFAFPSEYEGFGLPPLEAMACGAPVVCSDASSLPEVMGDAALLVPPLDARAWAQALGRVLSDADLRRDLSGRGVRQAARFSWLKTAQQTRVVYERLAGESSKV